MLNTLLSRREFVHVLSLASISAAVAPQAVADSSKPIVVAPDGSGDYRTIQAAVDSLPRNSPTRQVISIAPGTYREQVKISKDVTNLTLHGCKLPARPLQMKSQW